MQPAPYAVEHYFSLSDRVLGMDGVVQRLDAPSTFDAAVLDAARSGFDRAHPQRSARRVLYVTQGLGLLTILAAVIWAGAEHPALTFSALHYGALIFFGCAICWRLAAASNLTPLLWRISDRTDPPVYTILCPLYREANVVAALTAALKRLDYPGSKSQSNKDRIVAR